LRRGRSSGGAELPQGTYERTAASFDNPDFVAVVIHSYRHRFGLVEGDSAYEAIKRRLAALPPITAPTITLDGDADGVMRIGGSAGYAFHFTGHHEHRIVAGAGRNLPQEAPQAFAEAVLAVRGWRDEGR
jgi:pimeloyl-ACP methyl ester carboxylesterase